MEESARRLVTMEVPSPDTIGKLREELGLSQRKLASELKGDPELFEVSQSHISKIEACDSDGSPRYAVSYRTFYKLFRYLQVRVQRKWGFGKAASICSADIESVSSHQELRDVVRLMRKRDFSQLPVMDGDGVPVGRVTETDVLALFERSAMGEEERPIDELTVADVMQRVPFPLVPSVVSIIDVSHYLKNDEAVLVTEGDRIVGIITRADMMTYYTERNETAGYSKP